MDPISFILGVAYMLVGQVVAGVFDKANSAVPGEQPPGARLLTAVAWPVLLVAATIGLLHGAWRGK